MDHTLPAHETCQHRKYLLSCEVYERMLVETGQRCELCGDHARNNPGGKLYIDHDYKADWAVRGLLCNRCNTLLGIRPPSLLLSPEGAARYLANPWYKRRMRELGVTEAGPGEPPASAGVADPFGREWTREGAYWRQVTRRGRPTTWARLIERFGPLGLMVL